MIQENQDLSGFNKPTLAQFASMIFNACNIFNEFWLASVEGLEADSATSKSDFLLILNFQEG